MSEQDTKELDSVERRESESEHPTDLTKDREAFVRQFLRKGFEVTETLLEENREIRDQLHRIREENALLREHVASDDAIRDLLRKIEQLEADRKTLLARSDELDERSKRNELRTGEIEQELHDLANLYIASSHLHATLSVRGVMKHLAELLQQLMGADRYAIYLADRTGTLARPVLASGLKDLQVDAESGAGFEGRSAFVIGEGPIGVCMMTGVSRIREESPLTAGTLEDPIAIIPMNVRDVCIGAIVVVSLLSQKERWAAVDLALFDFLGTHSATALIAANQYARASDPRIALEGIENHLAAAQSLLPTGRAASGGE